MKPRLKGRAYLIRYADDFVIGFTDEADARRVMEVLPKRFGKYGLTLHPDKTRLVPFRATAPRRGADRRASRGRSTCWGSPTTGRSPARATGWSSGKTARSRLSRAMRSIAQWCRLNRHRPIGGAAADTESEVTRALRVLRDHGQRRMLWRFRTAVVRCWRKWLSRRNRERSMTGTRFSRLLGRYPLPAARVVHSVYRPKRMDDLRNRML